MASESAVVELCAASAAVGCGAGVAVGSAAVAEHAATPIPSVANPAVLRKRRRADADLLLIVGIMLVDLMLDQPKWIVRFKLAIWPIY